MFPVAMYIYSSMALYSAEIPSSDLGHFHSHWSMPFKGS